MAIYPVGNYRSTRKFVKKGEAIVKGTPYKLDTAGELTAAATTDTPAYVALESVTANATYAVSGEFVEVTPDQEFMIDIVDANGDCILETATSGVSTGLYINDTANRNEVDNAFQYGTLYLPGVEDPVYPGCQRRIIAGSDQSDTRITVTEPFVKNDGTALTTNTQKYIVTTLAPGQRAVNLNAAGTGLNIEATISGGKVIIVDWFDLSNLFNGKIRQKIRFDI